MSDRTRMVWAALIAAVSGAAGFTAGWAMHGSAPAAGRGAPDSSGGGGVVIEDPARSVVYLPFDNAVSDSPGGRDAAGLLLRYLDGGDPALLERAVALYDELIATENFGGEYPPLRWWCTYELADEAERERLLADPDGRRFLAHFAADGHRNLRWYLLHKYGWRRPEHMQQLRVVDELVRFNGPGRAAWEHSEEIVDIVGLGPGDRVADVGSGPGFFSFRFADVVGDTGQVYAVDTNEKHLAYIDGVIRGEGIANIQPIHADHLGPEIADHSLDRVFMCSMYQAVYASVRDDERRRFLDGVRRVLAPDGRLVVSDNHPYVAEGLLPYRGIGIAQELVVGQLEALGFELVSEHHLIPQRYVLVLRPSDAPPR